MIDAHCPIYQSGKGFCWAPSSAWGCSDKELCAKCKAKDRGAPVKVEVAIQEAYTGNSTKSGKTKCTRCIFEPNRPVVVAKPRTCRFCGTQNVYSNQWREKEQMCSKKACWEKYLAELKFAI